jgi:outer membrane protein
MAQNADNPNVWTLKQCVEEGIKNNIQLKQNQLNIETSDVNYNQAVVNRLPSLGATANQSLNFGYNVDPTTYQYKQQQISSNNLGINSSIVLFNGFRINNMVKQNQYTREATIHEYNDNKNTLILNIVNAYIQVLFNKELLTNNQNQVSVTGAQLSRTEKLVTAGSLAESNLLDLVSKRATDELNVIIAENQLNIAKLNLLQYMNVPLETVPTETLDIENPLITIDTSVFTDNVKDVYKSAERTQPSIKGAQSRIKSAEIGVQVAQGNKYPRLTLNGNLFTQYANTRLKFAGIQQGEAQQSGYTENNGIITPVYSYTFQQVTTAYPLVNQWKDNFSQSVTFNLTIPIFNNFLARNGVQNAIITNKNATLNYENAKVNLRRKIEQAFVDMRSAKKKFEASKLQVRANEEAFRITEKRFNAGITNAVDYTVSSNTLYRSKSDLLQAEYDFFLKLKILNFYKDNEMLY